MASVDSGNNPNDPNDPNNAPGAVNQPGTGGTNQPATSGGAGAVTTTGASNVTGQVVGTSQPSQPFQNISSYLTANAPQSADLANKVAGTVSAPITQANTDIGNAANQFTESVNKGYTPENPNVVNSVSSNPTTAAQNPKTVQDFLSNLNDVYSGPSDFTAQPNYGTLQSDIASANAAATNTQTPQGIQTLLKQTEGPGTTAGINNLDSLLLNLNPTNLATVQAAGAPAAGLTPSLATATSTANAQAAAAKAAVQKAQANAQAALNTANGNLTSGVNSELAKAMTGYTSGQKSLADLTSAISKPGLQGLTVDQMHQLGIDPSVIEAYAGIPTLTQGIKDLFGGIAPPMTNLPGSAEWTIPDVGLAPTVGQVATPEDYATLAALTQLSGGKSFNSPISASTASQSGTYKAPSFVPAPNNQALAQDLYNYLNNLAAPGNFGSGKLKTLAPYEKLVNQLSQYLAQAKK